MLNNASGFRKVYIAAGKEKGSVQESICYKALQIIQTMFRYRVMRIFPSNGTAKKKRCPY